MNLTLLTILRRLHPLKGFCYDEAGWSGFADGVLEVKIRPREGSRGKCSECMLPGPTYDHQPQRSWQFVPLWGVPVFLAYAPRRIDCPECGVRIEKVPWAEGKIRIANVFRLFLATWARKLSWKETAEMFTVGWDTVYQSVRWVVAYGKKHRTLGQIVAIGVDEINVRLGRQFWTLVYQIDDECKRLLWVGKDRTADTFDKFFDEIGKPVADGIRFICSDMWKAYLEVAARRLDNALHILDRFHIRQRQNEAVDKVRKEEAAALAEVGLAPRLKKMRWAFLKRRKNWTSKERRRMRDLLTTQLRTIRAFLLVEAFDHFWSYRSPWYAGQFLDGWCRRVARSKLEPLKKVANSLKKHRSYMINYFVAKKQISGGVIEGLNNKVKLTIRKSYGFRTDDALEVALFHCLGKLPEPEVTHRFL